MDTYNTYIPVERIEKSIFLIWGHKILLDSDLADLYDVETKYLIQAVKRNMERFPPDFMFQLTQNELASWGHKLWPQEAFQEIQNERL